LAAALDRLGAFAMTKQYDEQVDRVAKKTAAFEILASELTVHTGLAAERFPPIIGEAMRAT